MTLPFLHPRRRTLVAFALGDRELSPGVTRHLERCSDCRRIVGFTRRLASASSSLPTPAPPEELLARAMADRAGGALAILPTAPPSGAPVAGRGRRIAGVLVAASLAVLLFHERTPAGEFRGAHELLLAGLAPTAGEAGHGGDANGVLTHRLQPMEVVFQRRIVDGATGRSTDWGFLDIRVDSGTADATWVVSSLWRELDHVTDMQNARAWADTLTVAARSLAPIRRIAHVTPFRRWAGIHIDQSFRGDSVVGQMSLDEDPTRRPIAHDLRSVRGRLIASDALSPFWLMGVPLARGTTIDASILGWAVVPNDVLASLRIEVVGSERVQTPAGSFDCWVMTVSTGGETHSYWVRKSDHLGVLTRRRLTDGTTREVVLYREETAR